MCYYNIPTLIYMVIIRHNIYEQSGHIYAYIYIHIPTMFVHNNFENIFETEYASDRLYSLILLVNYIKAGIFNSLMKFDM